MDFLSNASLRVLWSSSAAAVGTTGDQAGTTAGSASFTGQSTAGGYPTASTGLDMSGFRSLLLVATVAGATGAVLKAGFSTVGSSAAITGWTDLAGAGVSSTSPSTTYTVLSLDLAHVAPRYLAGIVQVPTSSAVVTSIVAFRYNPVDVPVTQPTNNAGSNSVMGSTS